MFRRLVSLSPRLPHPHLPPRHPFHPHQRRQYFPAQRQHFSLLQKKREGDYFSSLREGNFPHKHCQVLPSLSAWRQHLPPRRPPSPAAAGLLGAAAALAATAAAVSCEEWGDEAGDVVAEAVAQGRIDTVRQYLQTGGNPNYRQSYGSTLLHLAVARGYLDIARLLLESGADVNARDHYNGHPHTLTQRLRHFGAMAGGHFAFSAVGLTPLHYAALADNLAMMQLLMEYRADPTLTSLDGLRPKHCVSLLQSRVILEAYEEDPHYADEFAAASGSTPIANKQSPQTQQQLQQKIKDRQLQHRRNNPLEKHLREHIVGQEGPILSVSAAIRRRLNGWHDRDRPLVFLFLGSSGVGKTETAKKIAEYIADQGDAKASHRAKTATPTNFVRFDMSEFQEKHEVAKLIGAPPGYIGYESGGMLVNALKKCPNAVVLLDEVEKAHPDVLNIMLQVFDEGRLTDGQGRTVACPNAIFIMTSNLGSSVIADHGWELRKQAERVQATDDTFELSKEFKDKVMRPILKAHFQRDEFLGRIDEILYFVPFSRRELSELIAREFEKWNHKAQERHGVTLKWDDSVIARISQEYDAHYGARSLQHAVDRLIINRLAAAYEKEELKPGDSVILSANPDDSITIRIELGKGSSDGSNVADDKNNSANSDNKKSGLARLWT